MHYFDTNMVIFRMLSQFGLEYSIDRADFEKRFWDISTKLHLQSITEKEVMWPIDFYNIAVK